MTSIVSVTLEASEPQAAEAFYRAWLGDRLPVRVRGSQAPTSGFRGFTLSLVAPQPSTVNQLAAAAVGAGATTLKPVAKSLWGYGGSLQAPDGTIWTIASSSKKDTGPDTGEISDVVLLLGVSDVKASKRFYLERGLQVNRSFGSKYVEFGAPDWPIKLSLYGRRALAKNGGVPPEGSGSHRLVIGTDGASFTDPDGFEWETVAS